MRDRIFTAALAVIALLVSFTATTFAAGAAGAAAPAEGSVLDLAKPVMDAVMNGQGWIAAALALVFATSLARRCAPGKAGELARGDLGGVVTAFLMSFGGAAATALAATGGAPSLDVFKVAAGVAMAASGGYTVLKKFAVPLLKAIQAKVPAWASPIVGMLIWVCERPDVIGKARAAGDAAVKAKPAPGVAGVTGAPKDWP